MKKIVSLLISISIFTFVVTNSFAYSMTDLKRDYKLYKNSIPPKNKYDEWQEIMKKIIKLNNELSKLTNLLNEKTTIKSGTVKGSGNTGSSKITEIPPGNRRLTWTTSD